MAHWGAVAPKTNNIAGNDPVLAAVGFTELCPQAKPYLCLHQNFRQAIFCSENHTNKNMHNQTPKICYFLNGSGGQCPNFSNTARTQSFVTIYALPEDKLRACTYMQVAPIPVAARSKASFCGQSLAGIAGSNPAGKHEFLPLVTVVCCQVVVCVSG